MTIIGLGNTGCNIAEKFEQLENVNVYLIDSNIEGEQNCISIPEYSSPEDYEKYFPNIIEKLSNIDNEIYLIIGGSGKISGASLSLLSQLKDKELNVVYIRPERASLNSNYKLQDNLTFNVFQEYARSGVFKNCFLVDNSVIEKILGELPIVGFFDKLNDTIFNSLGFILTYKNKPAIINNIYPRKDISRICTIGFYDLEKDQEDLLYELENIDTKHFYFVFSQDKLKNDGTLLKNIKKTMLEKTDEECNSSFAIFSNDTDLNYCYMIAFSKRIQK